MNGRRYRLCSPWSGTQSLSARTSSVTESRKASTGSSGEGQAAGRAVEAFGVGLGPERPHGPVRVPVGLHALEDLLRVVQDGGGRVHGDGSEGHDGGVPPPAVLRPDRAGHVIGEVLTELGVLEDLGAAGATHGGWGLASVLNRTLIAGPSRFLGALSAGGRHPNLRGIGQQGRGRQGGAPSGVDGKPGRQTVLCIGTDLVDVAEMRAALLRQPRFRAKAFTASERAYCEIPDDPAERYAVRFAAKEAVLKALGTGLSGSALTEIEVRRAPDGKPSLLLTGRAAALSDAAGVHSWLISLTHTATRAHAMVAGVGAGPS